MCFCVLAVTTQVQMLRASLSEASGRIIFIYYSSHHEQIDNNLPSCVCTHVQSIVSCSKSQTLTYQENKPIFDVLGMTTKEISCSFIYIVPAFPDIGVDKGATCGLGFLEQSNINTLMHVLCSPFLVGREYTHCRRVLTSLFPQKHQLYNTSYSVLSCGKSNADGV